MLEIQVRQQSLIYLWQINKAISFILSQTTLDCFSSRKGCPTKIAKMEKREKRKKEGK